MDFFPLKLICAAPKSLNEEGKFVAHQAPTDCNRRVMPISMWEAAINCSWGDHGFLYSELSEVYQQRKVDEAA